MKKLISSFLIYSLIAQTAFASPSRFGDVNVTGQLRVGDNSPADPTAAVDLSTSGKGLGLPQMTTAQRNALVDPLSGLTIFNLTTGKKNVFNGTSWVESVSTTETQTLTNKTLTSPTITGAATSGSTITSSAFTGGSIDNTTIGATTPSTGKFLNLGITGTAGGGWLNSVSQSVNPLTPASGWTLFADSSNRPSYILSTGKQATWDFTGITAARNYTFPDASTTVVGTDTTQTLTNKTITGNTAANLKNGAATITLPSVTGTVATLAGTEVLTNKDIDGGTASNTSRITLPKDTFTNLQALTRKEGTLVYAKDQAKAYVDNGTALVGVGSGSGGDSGNLFSDGGFETDTSNITTLTSATAITDTTNVFNGVKSAALTFTTTSSSASMVMTPTAQLKGTWLEASCRVKTSVIGLKLCALDNGTEYSCQDVPTGDWAYVPANWQPGVNGNPIGLRVKSTSNSGSLNIDYCYVGVARNMGATLVSTAPTVQKFLSGSGNYTVPTNPSPLYIEVELAGAGGGGGAGATGAGAPGLSGGSTTFGSSLLTCTGGAGGPSGGGGVTGGAGGSCTVSAPATQVLSVAGGAGSGSVNGATVGYAGGLGGSNPLGGAGATYGGSSNGVDGSANTGAGGGGGGGTSSGSFGGNGGGAGGYARAIIQNPSTINGGVFAYAVGSGGTKGSSTSNGGNGGSGVIIVREFYGNNTNTFYQATNGGLNAGDILATAATACPTGTIAADGSSYLRTDYPALYQSIGTSYGASDATHFSVPDFRWMFGRGFGGPSGGTISAVNTSTGVLTVTGHNFKHSGIAVRFTGSVPSGLLNNNTYYEIYVDDNNFKVATTLANALAGTAVTLSSATTGGVTVNWQDPDSASRVAQGTGGNSGNALGSVQADAFMDHTHASPAGNGGTVNGTSGSNAVYAGNTNTQTTGGSSTGGNETRPKNVYVNYCVRTVPASPGPVILPNSASSSSTGTNYVTGGDAESGTNQCTPYANTAAVAPTTGAGGSPTVTCSISTSSPITGNASYVLNKPASNVQGQGWSFPITVGNEGKAKMLQVSFDYKVDSNYTVGSDSTTPDMVAYVYGPTDAGTPTLTQLTPYKALGGSGYLRFQGNFQTALSGSAYRLILHEPNTGTLASSIQVDNIVVSPVLRQFGTPVTDTGTVYNPTVGPGITVTANGLTSRRVGDRLYVHGTISTSTPTSSAAKFTLPAGLSIDTTKLTIPTSGVKVGSWSFINTALSMPDVAFGPFDLYVSTASGTDIYLARSASATAYSNNTWVGVPGNGVGVLQVDFSVPIQGWSSSTQMSDQSGDNRQVILAANTTAGSTVSGTLGAAYNTVIFSTPRKDTLSGYNTTTGKYVVAAPGYYWVSGGVDISAVNSSGNVTGGRVGNSTTGEYYYMFTRVGVSGTADYTANAAGVVWANAGDTLELDSFVQGTSPSFSGSLSGNYFTVSRNSGNQQIAASDSVQMRVNNSTTSIASGGTSTIIYTNKIYDSHNAYNTSTGVWTSPKATVCSVKSGFGGSWSAASANRTRLYLYKNGSQYSELESRVQNPVSSEANNYGSDDVQVNAGDTLNIALFNGLPSALNGTGTASQTYFSIMCK